MEIGEAIMKRNDLTSSDNLETLIGDLRLLIAKAERIVQAFGEELSNESVEALRASLGELRRCLGEAYLEAKERARSYVGSLPGSIQAHPYRALALALAGGLLAGSLAGTRASIKGSRGTQ